LKEYILYWLCGDKNSFYYEISTWHYLDSAITHTIALATSLHCLKDMILKRK